MVFEVGVLSQARPGVAASREQGGKAPSSFLGQTFSSKKQMKGGKSNEK
jgi:hypothetical protein